MTICYSKKFYDAESYKKQASELVITILLYIPNLMTEKENLTDTKERRKAITCPSVK